LKISFLCFCFLIFKLFNFLVKTLFYSRYFSLKMKFLSKRKLEFTIKFAIVRNGCYQLPFCPSEALSVRVCTELLHSLLLFLGWSVRLQKSKCESKCLGFWNAVCCDSTNVICFLIWALLHWFLFLQFLFLQCRHHFSALKITSKHPIPLG